MLNLKTLTKTFGQTTAVDQVTLSIDEGEIVCLLGPSGCGKTTLLRLMAGLETADSGTIFYHGRDIASVPPHERGFGMMFQNYALFPHKNVFDNIAFGLKMQGGSQDKTAERVNEMLSLVALDGYGQRTIDQLSGGEQQRVALARALAVNPEVLLLDEPLGALDRALRERLMVELQEILKRVGVTAVYVTHDQTEAFAIADRIAVMNEGEIEQIDRPERLYQRPQTPFVARFLGFENVFQGRVEPESGAVITPIGRVKPAALTNDDVSGDVQVLILPDAAEVSRDKQEAVNQLTGRITAILFRGRYYQLLVDINGREVQLELDSVETLSVDRNVSLKLRPEKVVLL